VLSIVDLLYALKRVGYFHKIQIAVDCRDFVGFTVRKIVGKDNKGTTRIGNSFA
jgi:hypothetical protein